MLQLLYKSVFIFASSTIENAPGFIMGPINDFLGAILNIIFNLVHFLTEPNSLGITIIIFTLITRCLMIPSGIKSQRSMLTMRKLQPEIEKIKVKYGGSKDPETQRKMNAEMQVLYSANNYNPLSGCIPMFITLPIFMALSYLLRQPYMYIGRIGTLYNEIALLIQRLPDNKNVLETIIQPIVDNYTNKGKIDVDIRVISDMVRALNKFSSAEWNDIMSKLADSPIKNELQMVLNQKTGLETFAGLNLLNRSGFALPGILIPILSSVTQFASSFYSFKVNPPTDSSQKTTQMMMLVGMPLFMGYVTASFSIGVGIYWITGNVFFFFQQLLISRYLLRKQAK